MTIKSTAARFALKMLWIANQTLSGWPDNIKIRDRTPNDYALEIKERQSNGRKQFGDDDWGYMQRLYGLPELW